MWYPWGDERPPDAQVFDETRLSARSWHELRELLALFGVSHLWELRGFSSGLDYEIELALLEPVDVSLGEMFWSEASLEWLIYRSHEDTVTIAGAQLLSGLRAAWPEWRSFVPDWA
jgi:hypothetical protein